MPATARTVLFATTLCFCTTALCTTVQRCEDSAGQLTFTYQGCPSGSSMQFQEAYNALPGSQAYPLTQAVPARDNRAASANDRPAKQQLVVVGERDDGCGNLLSGEQRRRAIINQQIVGGMSKRDVESSLGKPDKISGHDEEVRYSYEEKNGRSSKVTFDKDGCVKAKR